MNALKEESKRLNNALMMRYEPYDNPNFALGLPRARIYTTSYAPDPLERSWRFNMFLNVAKELFLQRDTDEMEAVYELACAIAVNKGYSDFLNELLDLYTKCQGLISLGDTIAKTNRRNRTEALRGLDWSINDVFIIEILDYLSAANKYILFNEKQTSKRLCLLLKTTTKLDRKIVWNDTSVKFGKLFHIMFDSGCFKEKTTKENIAKRLLEIFEVKGKNKIEIGHNTLRSYLSGDSLEKINSETAPYLRIKKIIKRALSQG